KIANANYRKCKYNPAVFGGLILNYAAPKCSVTLHGTGTGILMGVKSRCVAKRVLVKITTMLQKIGFKPAPYDLTLKSATYSGKFPFKPNLKVIKQIYGTNAYHEPELFNGLRLSLPNSKGVLTVFYTGKFTLTGIKDKFTAKQIIETYSIEFQLLVDDINSSSNFK
ncbi:TATA-box-binding protein-like isoform X1, partial [Leptotrombidium deliense]